MSEFLLILEASIVEGEKYETKENAEQTGSVAAVRCHGAVVEHSCTGSRNQPSCRY